MGVNNYLRYVKVNWVTAGCMEVCGSLPEAHRFHRLTGCRCPVKKYTQIGKLISTFPTAKSNSKIII
jgi:hypothetical protein